MKQIEPLLVRIEKDIVVMPIGYEKRVGILSVSMALREGIANTTDLISFAEGMRHRLSISD